MKKIFIVIFSLVLCACENNNNPKCIKTFDTVQIFGVADNPSNGIVAVAKACDFGETTECNGQVVLIPKGMVPVVKAGEKITVPRHHCFVFIGDYEDVDKNNVVRRTPVIDLAYNKKVLVESDVKDIMDDMAEREYQNCLQYASKEFKKIKSKDNEKTCRCVVDFIYSDKGVSVGKSDTPDRFANNLRATLKKKCGKNIPAQTLRGIPTK